MKDWKLYLGGSIILALLGISSSMLNRLRASEKQVVDVRQQLDEARRSVRVEYRTVTKLIPVQQAGKTVYEKVVVKEAVHQETEERRTAAVDVKSKVQVKISEPKLPLFWSGGFWGVTGNRGKLIAGTGMNFGNASPGVMASWSPEDWFLGVGSTFRY